MGVGYKTPSTLLDVGKLPHRSVRKYSSAMEATCPPQKGRSVKSAFGVLQTHPCAPIPPGLSSIVFPDWTVPVSLHLLPASERGTEAGTRLVHRYNLRAWNRTQGNMVLCVVGGGVDGWRDGKGIDGWMREGMKKST